MQIASKSIRFRVGVGSSFIIPVLALQFTKKLKLEQQQQRVSLSPVQSASVPVLGGETADQEINHVNLPTPVSDPPPQGQLAHPSESESDD